jgi:hypothetical protein
VAEVERLTAGSALARVLASNRPRYNAAFAGARRGHPRLDQAAFEAFLCGPLNRIATALAVRRPDRVAPVVDVLFDVGIELLAANLLGPDTRYPAVAKAWDALLPACAALAADDPRRVAAAVSNALFNLERQKPGAGDRWLDAAQLLAAACETLDTFLDSLLVAGWRCGLAHYRDAALERWRSLPAPIARIALGLSPDGTSPTDLGAQLTDPWWRPAANSQPPRLQIVARVGGFRGLGGPFVRPPQVACVGDQLLAFDRDSCWTIHADAFGSMLTRFGSDPPANGDLPIASFTVDKAGTVLRRGVSARFDELRDATSFAATPWTLAVTVRHSHLVHLVALAGQVVP